MKLNEVDYLNKLFASSSDVSDEVEVDVPEAEMPDGLSGKLHAIAEKAPNSELISTVAAKSKLSNVFNWPVAASIAASFFVAVLGFQFYQQQQTLRQLEQAQADLSTALHYIGEANRIARSQVAESLNENIKRAGVQPAKEIGRDALLPDLKKRKPKTQIQSHSL